jgi:hypothetical protein
MVHIYINETDVINFQKLISNTWHDDIVVSYYLQRESTDLIKVSLNINDYIGLTDRNLLQKISLLQN